MSQYDYAKLRPIEVKRIIHQGQPVFFLRDPLELSKDYAFVPQILGPLLAACDGAHTVLQMQQEFMRYIGQFISQTEVEHLLGQLDQIYLLDDARAAEARTRALDEFRRAPYRPPTLAGLSYPADPEALRRELQGFMEQTPAVEELEEGWGVFSPHIDYMRGGPVYAQLWKRAAKLAREAEIVVLFGTDHNSLLPGQLTLTRQNYATSFGVLPTDQSVVDAVVDVIGEEAAFAEELHHRREHSLELVLTWLHFIRNGASVPIVPILNGSFQQFIHNGISPADDTRLMQVVQRIKEATAGRKLFVVASGDLAHLGPAFGTDPIDPLAKAKLKQDDEAMLQPLIAGDADGFFEVIRRERGQRNVCGTAPFYLTMKLMGDNLQGEVTAYDCCLADDKRTSFVSVCGMVFK